MMLSPRMRQEGCPRTKSAPMTNACARPFGLGCAAYSSRMPHCVAVAEQMLEGGLILRRGDDQHVADLGQHQRRQRIVDHRLVVDRQQLLRRHQRERMQPRAGAAGENDALTRHDAPLAPTSVARDAIGLFGPGPPAKAEHARELAAVENGIGGAARRRSGNPSSGSAVTRGVAAGERRLRGDDAARKAVPCRHAAAGE